MKNQTTPVTDADSPPPLRQAAPRIVLRLVLLIGIALLLHQGMMWLYGRLGALDQSAMTGLIVVILIGYAVMIAIPFMPGIEIGIALLLIQGASIAPFVYLATVLGLYLAYLIGRHIPLTWLHNAFRDMHMVRACKWLESIKNEPRELRLQRLGNRLPNWLARIIVNYRYVTLGTSLSIPGSFAIGGGGGILMMAGLSRMFSSGWVFVTLLIAVAPIPLIVWLTGTSFLA